VLIADWQRPQFIVPSRGALVWVDLTTKHRTLVSSGVGSGQGLGQPADVLVDEARERVLVADSHAAALIAVYRGTGNRFVLSDAIAGEGPALQGPLGLAADFPRNRVFVTDGVRKAVFSVDVVTGNRVRAGPPLDRVRAIALADEADTLLAAVGADLLAVDLVSGDRAYVHQADPAEETTRLGFTRLASGDWYAISVPVGDHPFEVVRVDGKTGARTVVSRPDQGKGPFFRTFPLRWQTTMLGEVLLISIPEASAVLAVDPVSGDRVIFSM
jgi:hypothetical protein